MAALTLDGYVRVSKINGREGEGFISPDVQREKIAQWAALRGVQIAEWHTDLDVSGGTLSRPGLDALMGRIRSGATGGLAVAALDRLSRAGVADALKLVEEIHECGGEVSALDLGVDPTTPFGEFGMTLMLALARMQRRTIAGNWLAAEAKAIGRGVHTAVPYGYVRADGPGKPHPKGGNRGAPLVEHPVEGPVVRRVYAERAIGRGTEAIAQGLNADRIPSPRKGGHWTRQTVRVLIKVRTYMGEAGKGDNIMEHAHPALVDEPTWRLAQPAGDETKVRGDGTILSGLVRCSACGYAMGSSTINPLPCNRRRTPTLRYVCQRTSVHGRCPSPTTCSGLPLHDLVIAAFFDHYEGVTALAADEYGADVEATRRDRDRLDAEYVAWRDDVDLRAAVGDADYRAGLLARKTARDAADDAHASAVRSAAVTTLPVDRLGFAEWPMLEQRALLRAGIARVAVTRAEKSSTPLAERVAIEWAA